VKEIFIACEASHSYSNGVILVPVHPLECVVSRIMHHAPIAQTVKQTIQLFRKRYTKRDGHAAVDTCCGLVNMYQTHHQPSVISGETYQKIEGSVKPISGTRCMKSGFNGGVRLVSADQSIA
jgi:hypothetical protein